MKNQTKAVWVGSFLLVIMAGLLVITNQDNSVRMEVSKDNTSIFVNESGEFTLGGVETTSILNNIPYDVQTKNTNKVNFTILERISKYNISNKIVTLDSEYNFNSSLKTLESFPIYETHKITNGKGLKFCYDVKIYSSRVKVTFDNNKTISESYFECFNITKSPQTFNIRIFDPYTVTYNSTLNKTYSYRLHINQSLITNNTLLYVNGTKGVLLNGTLVKIIAKKNTGNLSLYYNNATDYVVVENDTYIQPIYADENFVLNYVPDNTSSTFIIDNATLQHNGTASGGPTMSSDSASKYINFNGAGTVSIANPNNFFVGTNPWTISFWRYRTVDNSLVAFETGDGTGIYEILFYDYAPTNGPYLYIPNAAHNTWNVSLKMQPAGTNTMNTWNYYVMTRVGNTIVSYIDGVNYANASYSGSIPSYTGMVLGEGQNINYFSGRMASFIIMNRSVTNEEVLLRNSTGRNTTFIATEGYGNVYDYTITSASIIQNINVTYIINSSKIMYSNDTWYKSGNYITTLIQYNLPMYNPNNLSQFTLINNGTNNVTVYLKNTLNQSYSNWNCLGTNITGVQKPIYNLSVTNPISFNCTFDLLNCSSTYIKFNRTQYTCNMTINPVFNYTIQS